MNIDHQRGCKVAPWEYVEAEVEREVTNTNEPRTHPCLYLGPSGNRQGTSKCLDVDTNKVVHRRVLHVIPMPDDIKWRVEALGKWGAWRLSVKKQPFATKMEKSSAGKTMS